MCLIVANKIPNEVKFYNSNITSWTCFDLSYIIIRETIHHSLSVLIDWYVVYLAEKMAQWNGWVLALHSFWSLNCFWRCYQNYPKIAVSNVFASLFIKHWKNVISAYPGVSIRRSSCILRNNVSVPLLHYPAAFLYCIQIRRQCFFFLAKHLHIGWIEYALLCEL